MSNRPTRNDCPPPEPLDGHNASLPETALRDKLQAAEDEVRRLRLKLEETTAALAQARRSADSANEAKERFLSTISHELRTPLSAIVLWTSLIEDQKILDPDQLREALDSIKRSAEEQRTLIEDLVDTARIVSGKIRLDRRDIELAAVVHNGVDVSRHLAREKGIVIEETLASNAGLFHGDARRLQQLVHHLVQNAVKFTPAGGQVSVDLRRADGELVITVADTGIGIAPEFLEQIFERFTQVEHVRIRTESGLGVGLAIARKIAELHGGSILAESDGRDRGARFIVRLPAVAHDAQPALIATADDMHLAGRLTGRRILLIEDAAATRRALTAVLREAGADVDAVDSAPAAWESTERRKPDIIVSDLGLPTIDGFALLRQIRERETTADGQPVPAVAVTAFAGDDICQQALESGFQTCLTKPVEPLQLVTTLVALTSPSRD